MGSGIGRWLALFVALPSCDEPTPPAPPSAPTAAFDAEDARRFPLAGTVAYDLVWAEEGAVMAWGDPEGALRLARLDALGEVKREVRVDASSPIDEVAVGVGGGRLAVAWASGSELLALEADPITLTATAPAPLGRTSGGKSGKRGRLRVGGGRDGGLFAYLRGGQEPCEDGEPATCTSFGLRELPPDGSDSPRPRLALPHPCDTGVVGFAKMGHHFHYAVCNEEDGQPATTLFTIRSTPSYAQAERVLEGCEPLGLSRLGESLWVTAICGSHRAAIEVQGVEISPRKVALTATTIACVPDGIRLELGPIGGSHLLTDPVDRIAPLVPAEMAPPGSAAVFTGSALLVARPLAGDLELARYRCIDGAFLRDR